KKEISVKQNSILHLDFDAPIVDRASDDPFSNFNFANFESSSKSSLSTYLNAIEGAKTDDNIQGIFLDLSSIQANGVIISRIHEALVDFKSSGKFIYAFGEGYFAGNYIIASVADSVFLVPTGDFLLNGLSSTPMFFKGMFDKL